MSKASFEGENSAVILTLSSCHAGGHSNVPGSFLLFRHTCSEFVPGPLGSRTVCVIFLGRFRHRRG